MKPKTNASASAKRRRYLNRIYGATLLATFAILLAHSYRADRPDKLSNSITLFAEFLHVQGLRKGAPVKIADVTIGKVTKVTLQKPSLNVRVQIAISENIPIPSDSAAVIRSPDLTGTKILVIEPGGDEQNLTQGDLLEYTREPIEIESLVETIVERAEKNLAKKTQQAQ